MKKPTSRNSIETKNAKGRLILWANATIQLILFFLASWSASSISFAAFMT